MPDDGPKVLHAGERFRLQWIIKELQSQTIWSWVNFSSYSPINLQHLPQPVPKDALGYFQKRFTFADAFEDLLELSSGQVGASMSDTDKWFLSKIRHKITPGVEPDQWIASLKGRQLWDAYFSYPSIEEQALRLARDAERSGSHFSWDRVGILVRKASMCEEESRLRSINQQIAQHQEIRFSGQGDASRTVNQDLYELRNPWIKRLETTKRQEPSSNRDSPDDPNTSEDMFLAIRSMFADGWPKSVPSWDNIVTGRTPSDEEDSSWTSTFVSSDGSKVVTTVKHQPHIGMSQTTELRYDILGNLVQRRLMTRQFTSNEANFSQGRTAATEPDQGDQNEEDSLSQKKHQQTGWFWARRA